MRQHSLLVDVDLLVQNASLPIIRNISQRFDSGLAEHRLSIRQLNASVPDVRCSTDELEAELSLRRRPPHRLDDGVVERSTFEEANIEGGRRGVISVSR